VILLDSLAIRDFRNIARLDLSIPAEGAALVGDNGQGKTNLLEAVYYFHTLRSFRGARDADLVRFDAPAFHVRAGISGGTVAIATAAFDRTTGRKRVSQDGAEIRRLTTALGTLPCTIIAPRDVELVTGAPGERRRFLDVVLALTSPRYLNALQRYRATLARRNAALRAAARAGMVGDEVEVWEPALAEAGAVLIEERLAWVVARAEQFERLARMIGEDAPATMRYVTASAGPGSVRDALRAALERRRQQDVRLGATHPGPHRDDLALLLGGRDLRVFGSAGQHRTAAIALRLLERATLRAARGAEPLLLLDDPFAELDRKRSERILALLHEGGWGQTMLAVPRASDIPGDFTRLPRWQVRAGAVSSLSGANGTSSSTSASPGADALEADAS